MVPINMQIYIIKTNIKRIQTVTIVIPLMARIVPIHLCNLNEFYLV